MKICKNCFYNNPDDALYCRECGKNLNEQTDVTTKTESVAIIENLTLFNKATLKSFYNGSKFVGIISLIFGVLFFALGLFSAIDSSDYLVLVLSIILLIISPTMFALYKKFTSDKRFSDTTYQNYNFYDDVIKIRSFENGLENGYTNLTYDKINKVIKKTNFIVIYVGSVVYILNAEGFTVGNVEQLKNLLKEKCGNKVVKLK